MEREDQGSHPSFQFEILIEFGVLMKGLKEKQEKVYL